MSDIVKKYITYLVLFVAAYHLIIGYFDQELTDRTKALLLAPTAIYVAYFIRKEKKIHKNSSLYYRLHLLTYFLVNGSFWIHAGILKLFGAFVLTEFWKSTLYGMGIGWGIFLLLHTLPILTKKPRKSEES